MKTSWKSYNDCLTLSAHWLSLKALDFRYEEKMVDKKLKRIENLLYYQLHQLVWDDPIIR